MDAKTHTDQHATHGRVEDDPLVRGRGRYVADAPQPNQAYAVFARSPHAFARIKSIDTAAADAAPGVTGYLRAPAFAPLRSVKRSVALGCGKSVAFRLDSI